MFDKFLAIGSMFDWITPVAAYAQDFLYGPSHTFLIPHGIGWSGYEIARLLNRHGIQTWGLMIVGDTLMVSVRQTQARWAQYLLQREGIPIDNPLEGNPWGRPSAGQEADGKSAAGGARNWLDDLANKIF